MYMYMYIYIYTHTYIDIYLYIYILHGRRAMLFLVVLSYMTFLFAIETFSEGETVTDEVTWLPTITTKWSVILKNAIR